MEAFQTTNAKWLVRKYIDENDPKEFAYEVYVVWQCKTLQNWKWLIATTLADRNYYEVTYNGDNQEYYIDAYHKQQNIVFKESELP